jgi:hypothetical protein
LRDILIKAEPYRRREEKREREAEVQREQEMRTRGGMPLRIFRDIPITKLEAEGAGGVN